MPAFPSSSDAFGSSQPSPSSSSRRSESNEHRLVAIHRRMRLHAPPEAPLPVTCYFFQTFSDRWICPLLHRPD
ncbi:hypothetical protein PIB30_026962 [Stylosanthes scabra]|uniref:Uncharacterized protein n=1 Tax=Stylosanthes scabra TaxID=79078 RepID=A0ABU6QAQ6_9FABA|nr:hypothetical protein [Stylosanthes scabra]